MNSEEQLAFWNSFINFNEIEKAFPDQYRVRFYFFLIQKNYMKPSKFEKDIICDVDRTRTFSETKAMK